MHHEYVLHSSDLHLPQEHPLNDHLFILKKYAARPADREARGLSPDEPPVMLLQLKHRNDEPTRYSMEMPVADDDSFTIMWNAFARCRPTEVLRGYGLEELA